MILHFKKLTERKAFLPSHQCWYLSTFSCIPSADTTHLTSKKIPDRVGQDLESRQDADLNIIVRKTYATSSEDAIFQSLIHDPTCNDVKITDGLIFSLLNRFKDDWKSALGAFRWAESRGYRPLPELYDKLVDILGKMKKMDKMNALVEEMQRNNLVSLNTVAKVMRRFAGAGEWKEAVRTFDKLENLGLEKNTQTMNLLLDTLCKENKVERARKIFLELKPHIPPNANTFNIFIHGWCKSNRVEEAYWTIQEMKGYGCRPCVISYSTIIQSYCHNSDFQKVYELLDEMQGQGCRPNVVTFTTILCSLAKSNNFEEALLIPERMNSVGCKPDILFYNALIHTLGRVGRMQDALHVFEVEMPKDGAKPNTSTYNTMISMFCHHKQEQKALEFLRALEISPNCKPDVQSFYPLLKSCFKAGKTDSLLGILLDDMVNKHYLSLDLSTYTLLIHGFCKVNKCERAYVLFEEMIGQEILPRYQTCCLLLYEIKQKKMYDAADRIEEVIKKLKICQTTRFKANHMSG